MIANAINEAHSQVANVSVILEITAGGGNAVGKTFEELKMIIDGVTNTGMHAHTVGCDCCADRLNKTDRVGVCLDTCHMFAAGYDIRTQEAYDATMAQVHAFVAWVGGSLFNLIFAVTVRGGGWPQVLEGDPLERQQGRPGQQG